MKVANCSSIYFIDQNRGWAVGKDENFAGKILRTTNGGTDWITHVDTNYNIFLSIHFNDYNSGIIVGWAGAILITHGGLIGFQYQAVQLKK